MNTTTEIQYVGEATMITSDCIAIAFKRLLDLTLLIYRAIHWPTVKL